MQLSTRFIVESIREGLVELSQGYSGKFKGQGLSYKVI